jgi:DNA-directed RNA polymerase specialized sigma24 family protein
VKLDEERCLALIQAVQSGDSSAWKQLIPLVRPHLRRYCRGYYRPAIAQEFEALIDSAIWKAAQRFKAGSGRFLSFARWWARAEAAAIGILAPRGPISVPVYLTYQHIKAAQSGKPKPKWLHRDAWEHAVRVGFFSYLRTGDTEPGEIRLSDSSSTRSGDASAMASAILSITNGVLEKRLPDRPRVREALLRCWFTDVPQNRLSAELGMTRENFGEIQRRAKVAVKAALIEEGFGV